MGIIVRQPVHLPGSKQLGARLLHFGVVERELRPGKVLFKHDLSHVRRIDRYPAKSVEPNLGTAVLRAGDVITSVNKQPVKIMKEFLAQIDKNQKSLVLRVVRDGLAAFVVIK